MHTIGWDQESKSNKINNVFPLRVLNDLYHSENIMDT